MKIFERTDGWKEGCASLSNIGFCLLEVNIEGEVYTYNIPGTPEYCEVERIGNKWKIITCDDSLNCIEYVIPRDTLVGFAWYNIKESLWENSTYADTIRRCKEFFSIPWPDKAKTDYKTKNGFSYYVTRYGDVWNTERMTKVKGGDNGRGYRHVILEYDNVKVHRLVAQYFVKVSKDLSDQGLTEESLMVNHLDGNKLNNRWDNLEWTTNAGNIAHAYSIGLIPTTIDKPLLERIWQLLQEGWSDIAISKLTGVPRQTVNAIRRGTSPRYRTDKYTWPKHSPRFRVLDRDTIRSIYDDFMYTNMSNSEIARKYNVSDQYISDLRRGRRHADPAREYIKSKGLDRYWKGYRPPK